MHSIHLDPTVFACPPIADGKESFEAFLDGILTIREIAKSKKIKVYIPGATYQSLYDSGQFPLQGHLYEAIEAFDLKVDIQVRDILEIVNGMLQKLPPIEGLIPVDSILYETIAISPTASLPDHSNDHLRRAVADLLVLSCLAAEMRSTSSDCICLILRLLADGPRQISIRAEVLDYDGGVKLELPHKTSGTFSACATHYQLAQMIDPISFWLGEIDETEQSYAVKLALTAKRASTTQPNSPLTWHLGQEFLNSAEKLGFLHEASKARALLRSCVEVVLQENMSATHALRTGKGGDNPQRSRGPYRAWRRDIDREYHLHYWTHESTVVFSCVVVHNNFEIV